MIEKHLPALGRRTLLSGMALGCLAATLPGCATLPAFSLTEAVRRLLLRSSDNAFARLTAPDGYWDREVARLGLGTMLGARGDALTRILTSALVKDRLEDVVVDLAIEGSYRAAPIVADAVRVIGVGNALELIEGGPRAATTALRGELGDAIRVASDPVIAQLLNVATGTDIGGIAQRLAGTVDDAIWAEIGAEEAAIRADPEATGDPMLIDVFGRGGAGPL
jgi:hypothetical protein